MQCPKCKKRIPNDSIFCKECGQKIKKQEEEDKREIIQLNWERFDGVDNSDKNLLEKANKLAPIIFTQGGQLGNELDSANPSGEKLKDNIYCDVCYEFTLLFLHMIDVMSFRELGPQKRKIFMGAVVEGVTEYLYESVHDNEEKNALKNRFFNDYNNRQAEYSKYDNWVAEKGEREEGTLLWEFGRKISMIIGCKNDANIIMYIGARVIETIGLFNLKKLFNS